MIWLIAKPRVFFFFQILGLKTFYATWTNKDSLFQDASQPITIRAKDLLNQMTLEEKVAQLLHPWLVDTPDGFFKRFNKTGLGATYMEFCCGPAGEHNSSALHVLKRRNEMQTLFVNSTRLGIPVTFVMETLHSGAWGGTAFPMPINYGCAFNDTLLELSQRIVAKEARAIGADRGFSPVINIFPDPRYGRLQEGYSEDIYLTKRMGAAALKGLQGGSIGGPDTYLNDFDTGLVATVKHYAAYGKTSGGIDGSSADISEQTLRQMYLAPWEYLAHKRGLRSVMAAQNMVNGRPMHANKRLLTNILRDEWGVKDVLIESDGGDCIGALNYGFHMVATQEEAAIVSLEAGMDMDLGGETMKTLVDAVKKGRTSISNVDRAAYNVLISKFAAGLFDSPVIVPEEGIAILDAPSHRSLALEAAQQSIVLLTNHNGFLPLNLKKLKTVAVIGPLADDSLNQLGGYTNRGARVVTVKEAIQLGISKSNITMIYARGANADDKNTTMIPAAIEAAKGADIAILVLGDTDNTCGEMYDRSSLDLPGAQLELLDRVSATGIDVVVILINGRPATFGPNNNLLMLPKAIMVAWHPGEEGGTAIWQILTGQVNPRGRLTQAWPRSSGHIGGPGQPYLYPYQGNHQNEKYCVDGPSNSLFGFGFGLSYSSFSLSNLSVVFPVQPASGTFNLSVIVRNEGEVGGSTVIQLYCNDPVSKVIQISSFLLCAYEISPYLAPGISVSIKMILPVKELAYWDDGKNEPKVEAGWRVDIGIFELYAVTDGFGSPGSWDHIKTTGVNTSVRVTTAQW